MSLMNVRKYNTEFDFLTIAINLETNNVPLIPRSSSCQNEILFSI
jgi:hypothetical protein